MLIRFSVSGSTHPEAVELIYNIGTGTAVSFDTRRKQPNGLPQIISLHT